MTSRPFLVGRAVRGTRNPPNRLIITRNPDFHTNSIDPPRIDKDPSSSQDLFHQGSPFRKQSHLCYELEPYVSV
jgi:hypothetical protein